MPLLGEDLDEPQEVDAKDGSDQDSGSDSDGDIVVPDNTCPACEQEFGSQDKELWVTVHTVLNLNSCFIGIGIG